MIDSKVLPKNEVSIQNNNNNTILSKYLFQTELEKIDQFTTFSEEFINNYKGKQPPWGFGALSYITYKRTYARYIPEENRKEEWWETVKRCIEGAQKIGAKYTTQEAERLFDLVFNLKCTFAGRPLWQLGTETIEKFGANSLLNCFAGETKVLTKQGWREIKDISGTEQELMTDDEQWVIAPINSFGKQKLYKLTYHNSSNEYNIYTTAGHNWIVINENDEEELIQTINLKKGYELKNSPLNGEVINGKIYVLSVEKTDRIEEVYCATVPETHSFVIDGNCLTGNCWFTSIDTIDSFIFLFENLMLGGGVGFSVKREHVHELPKVKDKVKITLKNTNDADFIIPDSREGWSELLRKVFKAYFITGKPFTYSTILIRGAGERIKTFGGVSSGPLALIEGVSDICKVLDGRSGKKIRSIDALDICNILGKIVVSGNVRRCIRGGSKVIEKTSGYKNIEHIKVGDSVSTLNGWKKVTNVFSQGKQKCVRVHHENGYLDCTLNHRIAILNSSEGYFEWKAVKDLNPKDRFLFVRSNVSENNLNEELINEETFFILGYLTSNTGFFNSNDNKSCLLKIYFKDRHNSSQIVDKIIKYLKNLNIEYSEEILDGVYTFLIDNCNSYFKLKNIIKDYNDYIIPKNIIRTTIANKISYLKGLFYSVKDSKKITSTDYDFINNLQNLIYSCGMESVLTYKATKHETKYSLEITTTHTCQQIFNEKSKNIKSNCFQIDYIPISILSEFKINKKIKTMSINEYEDTFLEEEEFHPILPIEFLKIEELKDEFNTYDIEVEDDHSFICEGILVHNSAEIAIGDVDDVLFLKAKRWDLGKLPSWRSNSNNSIYCDDIDELLPHFWEGYNGNGESYGLININNCRKYGRIGEKKLDKNVEGVNPCFAYNSTIITSDGLIRIGDWATSGETRKVWDGTEWVKARAFYSGKKKTLDISFSNGQSIKMTPNHIVETIHGQSIEIKDSLNQKIKFLKPEYYDLSENPKYTMLGFLNDKVKYNEKEKCYKHIYLSKKNDQEILDYFKLNNFEFIKQENNEDEYQLDQKVYEDLIFSLTNIFVGEESLTRRLMNSTPSEISSFLRGIYTAMGVVDQQNNLISLNTKCKKLSYQIQDLLTLFGIQTSLIVNEEKNIIFQNEKYVCEKNYVVQINSFNINLFEKYIGFIQNYKTKALQYILNNISNNKTEEKDYEEVINIDFSSVQEEPVYDFSMEKTHWASVAGFKMHNCGEITLSNYECCNLQEIFLNNIETPEELLDSAILLYKTAKAICSLNFIHEETNKIVHKNMRIGIGITGICQSLDKVEWLDSAYIDLKTFDAYWSNKNGYPESIRLTTVKPSGTVSLLAGATPGVHPGFSKHHIRRVRFASNDELVDYCRELGYHVEYSIKIDGTIDYDTSIVSFPCKFDEDNVIVENNMSIETQMDLIKKIQTVWSDNAVSCTVYYEKNELDKIKDWLNKNYKENVKSISFCLKYDAGFLQQMPLEEISEEKYHKMVKSIKPIFTLNDKSNKELDLQECGSGGCPIK